MWRPRARLSAGAVVWAVFVGTIVVCALGLLAARAWGAEPATPEQLRAQLLRERQQHATETRVLRARLRSTLTRPDAEAAMRLAGIVYGVPWQELRACALSEGYRAAERHQAHNARPNRSGSGAIGAWQFMPSTWQTTPFAGLPITRVDAQAFATAWMWRHGRRGEWAGAGC